MVGEDAWIQRGLVEESGLLFCGCWFGKARARWKWGCLVSSYRARESRQP